MNKRSQHTPGPWTQEASEEHSHVKIWGNLPATGPWLVAEVRADHRFENDEPNARLIAAAPDLLAALQDARSILYENGFRYAFADAAIAKAKGEP